MNFLITEIRLQAHINQRKMPVKVWPPNPHPNQRTSRPYKHGGEGRQNSLRLKTLCPPWRRHTSDDSFFCGYRKFFIWGQRNLEIVREQGYQNIALDTITRGDYASA